jgi:signal recognition particle subunit SEC65
MNAVIPAEMNHDKTGKHRIRIRKNKCVYSIKNKSISKPLSKVALKCQYMGA